MCFTITIHTSRKAIENKFKVDTSRLADFDFHYFYRAFSNPLLPVIPSGEPHSASLMQWGLIPSWSRDESHAAKIRKGTYNARAESLHEKAAFRDAFRHGRCLILASGFFEWQHTPGARIPWYIRLKEEGPFAFAGLSDQWRNPASGETLTSCSIITTHANPLMEKIHNSQKRMPVILPRGREKEWLADDLGPEAARQLLLPLDQDAMQAHTVSQKVSARQVNPADPELLAPHAYHVNGTLF